jgi:GntR family transcriptional regulator
MFIRIETSSGVPITRQITDQIRAQWAAGVLVSGDRLPSIRALARELAVNQNTILRAYERLTGEGLLTRIQGDGTYVAAQPPAGQMQAQKQLLRSDLDRLTRQARTLGLDDTALQRLVADAWERTEQESPDTGEKHHE